MLVFGGRYLWKQQFSPPPASGVRSTDTLSSVIVANFENKTGGPVFEATLTQGFTIQLQQLPVIAVVSPEHLRESMKLLGKSPNDPLTPAIAQEIGVREGDKAYITGDIAKLGEVYIISVLAIDPLSQDTVASAQTQAAGKGKVLDALASLTAEMRHKLGESRHRSKSSTCRSAR